MVTPSKLCALLLLPVLAAALTIPASAQDSHPTAREVIERIKKEVGVPWREQTVDTFKAGNPDTRITGIATTMMATLDVLERAGASGKNLVITHEPTFYGHQDKVDDLAAENDPVYAAKLKTIKKYNLVVWRFHDHWHARKPDGIQTGMVRALGWGKYQNPENEHLFKMPETTVGELASELKKRLKIRAVRVVGEPNMKIANVAFYPGAGGFANNRHALQRNDVDTLVVGETTEWETIEYVADAVTASQRKAIIVLGHVPSEQAGMEECARWLKGFVPEVPVEFVPTAEPFWTPK